MPRHNYLDNFPLANLVKDQFLGFKPKARFVFLISLLLIIGFSSTSLISYFVANSTLDDFIVNKSLPLTSDNIYSEVQRDILPSIVISSVMAQDTFIRDWILSGEKDPKKIIKYLKNIQIRYDTATAFFVSEKSKNYYHSSGVLKKISAEDKQDAWYFNFKDLNESFEINVDTDTADLTRTTFFVNHRINDYQDKLIGVIGVGLSSNAITKMIEHFQQRHNKKVYFAAPNGDIILKGSNYQGSENLFDVKNLAELSKQLLSEKSTTVDFMRDQQTVYLTSRYIPELNWYLLIEEIKQPETYIKRILWVNLLLSFVISFLVLFLAYSTIKRYQEHLVEMATTDKLTGIHNRHAFEPAFQQVLKTAQRNKQIFSLVLIDIDHFKKINDQHGHHVGDQVIKEFSAILKKNLRGSDLLCRWGGEEFLILLNQCDKTNALNLTEKIRQQIEENTIALTKKNITITASFGISQYQHGEDEKTLFERVDQALYKAKELGRNRIEIY